MPRLGLRFLSRHRSSLPPASAEVGRGVGCGVPYAAVSSTGCVARVAARSGSTGAAEPGSRRRCFAVRSVTLKRRGTSRLSGWDAKPSRGSACGGAGRRRPRSGNNRRCRRGAKRVARGHRIFRSLRRCERRLREARRPLCRTFANGPVELLPSGHLPKSRSLKRRGFVPRAAIGRERCSSSRSRSVAVAEIGSRCGGCGDRLRCLRRSMRVGWPRPVRELNRGACDFVAYFELLTIRGRCAGRSRHGAQAPLR